MVSGILAKWYIWLLNFDVSICSFFLFAKHFNIVRDVPILLCEFLLLSVCPQNIWCCRRFCCDPAPIASHAAQENDAISSTDSSRGAQDSWTLSEELTGLSEPVPRGSDFRPRTGSSRWTLSLEGTSESAEHLVL